MNSFVQRIEYLDPDVETRIKFFDDDLEPFEKQVRDNNLIQHSDLEYLPQGQIAEHCRDEDRLHAQVLKLIKESVRKSDPELMERFEDNREKISTIESDLESLTNRIHELDPESINDQIEEARRAVEKSKGDLNDIQDEIEEFRERHQSELAEDSVTELQNQIDSIDQKLDDLNALDNLVDKQLDRLETVEEYNSQISRVVELASGFELEISPDPIETNTQREDLIEIQDHVNTKIARLNQQKREIRDELEEFRDLDERISDLMNERRELNKEVESRQSQVNEIERRKEKLESLREERRETFAEYVDEMDNYENVYSIVINQFSEEQSEILDDLTFEASIEIVDGMISDLFSHLDGREVNYPELQPAKDSLREAIDSPGRRAELLDEYLQLLHSFEDNLKNSVDPVEYERDIYSTHFKLNENIYFEGSQMDALSLGQKGTVLLKILLAQDRSPLIIDQPEENLDNKFIYRSLKDAFKKAKTKRQVIIATHNANLVVNTDSEQVIVAEYEDNTIEFSAGALENPSIRESVTTILEGGERAFREREQKYGFS
jgi:chromosome segregation ATPase